MPPNSSKTSVSTLVSELKVGESVTFQDKKLSSVAVMVSNTKKMDAHSNKTFKLRQEKGSVCVTRHA